MYRGAHIIQGSNRLKMYCNNEECLKVCVSRSMSREKTRDPQGLNSLGRAGKTRYLEGESSESEKTPVRYSTLSNQIKYTKD